MKHDVAETERMLDLTPRIRAEIWCTNPDGTVRFSDFSGQCILLNKQGARIWRLLDQRLSIRQIIARAELDDPSGPASSAHEIMGFLQYLQEGGWVSLGLDGTWKNSFFQDEDNGQT